MMLQHLTWSAYLTSIVITAVIYYVFIGLAYYRQEFRNAFYRLIGKQPRELNSLRGDLILPVADIVGGIRTDEIDVVDQEELVFASPDEDSPVTEPIQSIRPVTAEADLLGDLSEMVDETKTLIQVINESNESKENFEMLFRLIVQKYPDLAGTAYEDQINAFVLKAGADRFPFTLTNSELQTYWLNEEKLQSA